MSTGRSTTWTDLARLGLSAPQDAGAQLDLLAGAASRTLSSLLAESQSALCSEPGSSLQSALQIGLERAAAVTLDSLTLRTLVELSDLRRSAQDDLTFLKEVVRYCESGRARPDVVQATGILCAVCAAPAAQWADLGDLVAGYLAVRYAQTGSRDDLDAAVELGRTIVQVEAPTEQRLRRSINHLTKVERALNQRGDPDLLEGALNEARLVAELGQETQYHAHALETLSNILLIAFNVTGNLGHLDEALLAATSASILTDESSTQYVLGLHNRANILTKQYDISGRMRYLDEAITLGEAAIARITEVSPVERPILRDNTASLLQRRFERTHRVDDIERAVMLGNDALDDLNQQDTPASLGMVLNNQAVRLQFIYESVRSMPEVLDESIAHGDRSLGLIGAQSGFLASALDNQANRLELRCVLRNSSDDIERFVHLGNLALDRSSADAPELARRLINQVSRLVTRYSQTANAADLDQATEILTRSD